MKNPLIIAFTCIFLASINHAFAQNFQEVKIIPEGKALVYIYRPYMFNGGGTHFSVNANDEKVSKAHLKNKTYLIYFATPGRYTFWAQFAGARMQVDVDVEAGKTYYIKGTRFKFSLSTEEEAKKELPKLKLSTPKG